MIAVVVFGIFLSLSYWLFQDEMQGLLASVVDGVKSGTIVTMDKTLVGNYDLGGNETPNIPEEILVPNAESDFTFVSSTGTIRGYTGTRKDVVIPNKIGNIAVTAIATEAFISKGLTSVVIPNSVTSIGDSAFYNNPLTSVVIPNSVPSIGNYAFAANKLTSVVIPNSVTSIGYYAFAANQLTSVVIPNSVSSIGDFAFANNPLTSARVLKSTAFLSNAFPATTVITRY